MQNKHIFETLSPAKLFVRCAVPSMVSMAVVSLYTIADGIFVGRCIGQDALAAVNLAMPVLMMSFALADLIAVGSSVQIAIHLGEKREMEASRIFSFCSLLIVAISCVAAVLGLAFGDFVMGLMGAGEAVTAQAAAYLKVYAAFSPAIMIFFALDNYLRICGLVRYSMLVNVSTALLNIGLDYLFLVVLRWPVEGAALASCIGMAAGTALSLAPFLSRRQPLRFVRGGVRPALMGNILANGSSEFFSNISGSVLMLVLNAVLLHLSGSTAVAAFSIVMYVDSVVGSLLFGLADSMQPAISYHYGAGKRHKMLSLEKRVMAVAAAVSLTAMAGMLMGGADVVSLFIRDGDPILLEMSIRSMRLFALSYLVGWTGTAISSFLTALNRPALSLALAMCRTLAFPLGCLAILPAALGLDGVWLTPAVGGFLTMLLALCLLTAVLRQVRPQEGDAA